MERTYTYQKPNNLFDTSSEMETISCNYVGPENILIVVTEDGKWSIETVPLEADGVYPDLDLSGIEEDFSIPDSTERYVVLDANNDNHIPLMHFIAGEPSESNNAVPETVGTFTHSDGTTFVLKFEDPNDNDDPIGKIDDDLTIVSADNNIDYVFTFKEVTDEINIDSLDQNIITSSERKMSAETVSLKKLWAKHIAVLEWIKSDIIGTVDPWKIVIPNVVDVELGATFEERNI